ncbi:MAG: HAMP domain-containing histidine kinase [Verrucomicrobiales bacterium]|nr:HAMP domain-containing histidine kinase [Verrucomicrobiales bacterium]
MKAKRDRPAFWRSIAFRIQSWYATALALTLAGMMVGFYHVEREHRIDALDVELSSLMHSLLPAVEPRHEPPPPDAHHRPAPPPDGGFGPPPGDGLRPPPPFGWHEQEPDEARDGDAQHALSSADGEPFWWVMWDRHGEIIEQWGGDRPPDIRWNGGKIDLPYQTLGGYRVMFFRGPHNTRAAAGKSLGAVQEQLRSYAFRLAGWGIALFVLGVLFGWLIMRWGLRPVHRIAADATRIAAGDRAHRIDTLSCAREIHELGMVLNDSFDVLQREIVRRERFTSDASHELRTPLSVVLGQLQRLISKPRTAEETHEIASQAHAAALRMRALIEQMMALARLDEASPTDLAQLDLAKVARHAAQELDSMIAEHESVLSSHLSSAMVLGDEAQLQRLLINLLSNAVVHTPRGSQLELATGCDEEGPWARVADNGPAIPPEHLTNLFERFYQVDSARSGGGCGLGLAICKKTAERHGGNLSVESVPGKGTTFTLRLPRGG